MPMQTTDNPNKLRKAKLKAIAEAKQITADAAADGDRDLTADEASTIDALLDQADEFESQGKAAEVAEQRSMRLADHEATLAAPGQRRTAAGDGELGEPFTQTTGLRVGTDMPRVFDRLPRSRIRKNLLAFENPMNAYATGRWILGALFQDHESLQWLQQNDLPLVRSALSGVIGTAGGFLTPDPMSNAIIDLRDTFGMARQWCNIWPMSSDHQTIPRRKGGVTAYAIGENTTITQSSPTFNQVELTARKWGALSLIPNELIADAIIDIADYVVSEMAYAFAEKEDDALFNGDGGSTYHGIQGIRPKIVDGNHTAGAVDAASGDDTFAEIIASDLTLIIGTVRQYAIDGGRAAWYTSQVGYANVFARLMAAGGGNTLGDLAGPAQYNYLGYPVRRTPKMPAVLTSLNDVAMILFGDLAAAVTLGDRSGFTAAVLRERYADADQTGIVAVERFDINVHDLGDNSAAGPLVALVGQS